jgi:hypothetical protein
MSKYLPATLGIAAMLLTSTALAKERSALESASVKAAADCVATDALKDPNITTLYREDRLDEVTDRIVLHSSVCDNPLRAMRLLHDRLYGQGTGRTFLRGDYLADLPRAVDDRISVEVAKRGLDSPDVRETYASAPLPPRDIDGLKALGWVYSGYVTCADYDCNSLSVQVGADGVNVRTFPDGPVIGSLVNGTPLVVLQRTERWFYVAAGCNLGPTGVWSDTAHVPLSRCN